MKDLILAGHVYFARGGATIDSITVGPEAKPDITPTSNWTKLPCVEAFQFNPTIANVIERRCGNPGHYETRKRIATGRSLNLRLSLQEFDELAFELMTHADGAISGDFVPMGATADLLEGWFKVQAYDQDDANPLNLDLYCDVQMDPYEFGDKLDPYALNLNVLKSSLTAGTEALA